MELENSLAHPLKQALDLPVMAATQIPAACGKKERDLGRRKPDTAIKKSQNVRNGEWVTPELAKLAPHSLEHPKR